MINRLVSQRYEVLEKIGESPMFTVYKARDQVLNRVVALKTISAAYVGDTPFIQGLQSGLVASANLNHPNITTFYEYGVDEGTPYAVFEFVRGINLKDRIRRIAPFTLSAAIDIACAIAEALQYAHALNQAHGDLRPQNIIISPEGAVKVTDFGVMVGVARSRQAQQGLLLRAAPYHAPELSVTQPGTPAGDIYALGAIIYEMLTGALVYAGDTPEAIADLHAFAPIPSPRTVNAGVPRSIEGVIVKCLQKRPDQRYHTALELLNDLKSVRDALRFGKSLSWSPIDLEPPVAQTLKAGAAGAPSASAARHEEPLAAAASSRPVAMSAKNRLRTQDERVSTVIKVMIGIMTSVILLCLIGFYAIARLDWSVPPPVTMPQMVGQPLDAMQAAADKLHIHLILHGDYLDRPRNIIYKTDQEPGLQIHRGHFINVWYSLGPRYVDVPNVVGMSTEDARQKLRNAGLTVGSVMPQYNDKYPQGVIISQNVSYKKRVQHDTVVDLIFSDGKQPDLSEDSTSDNSNQDGNGANNASGATGQDNPSGQDDGSGGAGTTDQSNGTSGVGQDNGQTGTTSAQESHPFSRSISITGTPEHGKSVCAVMIEYEDATGTHTVVEDNMLEGEKVPVSFNYYGTKITLRILYDGNKVFEKTFDPLKVRGRIGGGG